LCSTFLTEHYSGDKIKDDEMGWVCGTKGEEVKYVQELGRGTLEEKHV
jgi:hypothetical protein